VKLSLLYRAIMLLFINTAVSRHIPIPEQLKNELSLFALCRYPTLDALQTRLCGMAAGLATPPEERLQRDLIQRVREYLGEHYTRDVTLNEVAGRFYVSAPYLSRRFREKTRLTFVQYLEDIRTERARDLLGASRASIADIGEQVGYMDSAYFAKVFRKKYPLSPSDYREHFNLGTQVTQTLIK
jgi:two-component system response regulator YesN